MASVASHARTTPAALKPQRAMRGRQPARQAAVETQRPPTCYESVSAMPPMLTVIVSPAASAGRAVIEIVPEIVTPGWLASRMTLLPLACGSNSRAGVDTSDGN